MIQGAKRFNQVLALVLTIAALMVWQSAWAGGADDVTLETYDAVICTDAGNEGMLQIPVMSNNAINWVEIHGRLETDPVGTDKVLNKVSCAKNTYTIMMKLNATHPYPFKDGDRLYVKASINYSDNNGNTQTTEKTCDINSLSIIHAPLNFSAKPANDGTGSVQLTWNIDNTNYPDLIDGDMFRIQRSLTGLIEDYQDLDFVQMDLNTKNYSYTDATLISALRPEHIDKNLGIPAVRYRICRASTQLWGWTRNPTIQQAMPDFETLQLLKPKDFRSEMTNTERREVSLTWDYEDGGIWDERAEMKLVTLLYNAKWERVDSLVQKLTDGQRTGKKMTVKLDRPCVYYKFRLVVDAKDSPIGNGTKEVFFQINNYEDWKTFCQRVNNGETHLNAIMIGEFGECRTSINANYQGIFDGNGHTFRYGGTPEMSIFNNLGSGAIIRKLAINGNMGFTSQQSLGGLVYDVIEGFVQIESCDVQTKFLRETFEVSNFMGGVVCRVSSNASLLINNTCSAPELIGIEQINFFGGFVGFGESGCCVTIMNSLFDCSLPGDAGSATMIASTNGVNLNIYNCWHTIPETEVGIRQSFDGSKMTPDDIAKYCFTNWTGTDRAQPIRTVRTFTTPLSHTEIEDVSLGTDNHYYFKTSGKVAENSLKWQELQTSVFLTWELEDENKPIDYYEVQRKIVGGSDDWETIATNLTQTEYEDKTTSPVYTYLYRVRSAVDCEMLEYSYTNEVEGHCVQTGTLEGYVRFADGTGIPGITVSVAPSGENVPADVQEVTTTTDDSGYYKVEGLRYYGAQEGAYRVTVTDGNITNTRDLRDDCASGLPVTFDAEVGGNMVNDVVFTVTRGKKFSGFVMYEGTSIPVKGAKFLLNEREVRAGSKAVETDYDGSFSFWLLSGIAKPKIQVWKEGHTFCDDGVYEEEFSEDKAGIYFYDATKVKLIGRVAGGKRQGDLPLDNSLSRNNLGDSLKIVMALEGDNTSWLVYDNTQLSLKERDEVFAHTAHDTKYTYQTRMHTTRHKIEIWPDAHTGEYQVWLPPVAWKIQQITAEGYPTLFQAGKTGDVIDLTDSLTLHTDIMKGNFVSANGGNVSDPMVTYHAKYNRIYHAPVELTYKQINTGGAEYLGDKAYTAKNLMGESSTVQLAYTTKKPNWPKNRADSLQTNYTFGYPVFSYDRTYSLKLAAVETYYWNNNEQADTKDVVQLQGGSVTVQNQMISGNHREEVPLNDNGEATYLLKAAQTSYLLSEEQALRTVSFTLKMDGTTYEAEPLRAYVMRVSTQTGAQDILSIKTPKLIDILRDPPGGTSSAKLSKGSTLKYAYTVDLKWAAGIELGINMGTQMTLHTGVWAGLGAGAFTGFSSVYGVGVGFSCDVVFSGSGQRAFSYTITTNEDITTSSDPTMVGADADVYIGMETNAYVKPAVAIRAIPDSMYQQLLAAEAAGRLLRIAEGTDLTGGRVYLVRDEVAVIGDTVSSFFHHSQKYIMEQLLPELKEQVLGMLFTGTEAEAQASANSQNSPVYRLNVSLADFNHGGADTQKLYTIYYPSTWDQDKKNKTPDKVSELCQSIRTWLSFISTNEKEKLEAKELVKNFDVDGGSTFSYSEDFVSNYSYGQSNIWPLKITGAIDSFHGTSDGAMTADWFGSFFGSLGDMIFKLGKSNPSEKVTGSNNSNAVETTIKLPGFGASFSVTPVITYDITPNNNTSKQYNRKESFTIGMDKKSHLDFDVYRVKSASLNYEYKNNNENAKLDSLYKKESTLDAMDVFTEDNFLQLVDYDYEYLARHLKPDSLQYPRAFVYRTRGGATCRPYEGERQTLLYSAGSVLDVATKKIENPVIKLDKQSVSGVPREEPARFKIYLANESEQPEAIGGALEYMGLYMNEQSNPKGAKLLVDGMPLTGDNRTVKVLPGQVTEKTLEVYASEDFDYENLKIGLVSLGDIRVRQEVEFSVHFLRAAGPVTISVPGDKWVMNTDAATDSKGYYMPIVISGYDKNQKNFDHIEFQYKETNRGDDYWTNLCSYYASDSLYQAATGTKGMIPENGYISTKFYGEGVVMEKAYDLRAVLFVRNGSDYMTSSSKVLSGIKDTRRPRLFGLTEPKNGILTADDDITFNFSEAIEHNYLSAITNFEVMGETNHTSIQEVPALLFSGTGYAETEAHRNFKDKNVTVEMMIKPDDTGTDMPLFSHGTDGYKLQLWLTKDRKLKAIVNDDHTLESTAAIGTSGFQQVALVVDNEHKRIELFNDTKIGQLDDVTYSGTGHLIFGATNESDVDDRRHYRGQMLEGRVWNRAMDAGLLSTYGKHQLSGYEMGLIDYYPMDEGQGTYASDKAQGAHLELKGATWALPQAMSLHLDRTEDKSVKGLQLKEKYFSRDAESDYTLMFWFKTDAAGRGALLSNGSGRITDVGAENNFFIGFEAEKLIYRTGGMELQIPGDYSDDVWHHYAMTVNRAHNTGNIYMDGVLRQTFRTDSLGGMSGNHFYLGNMVWFEQGEHADVMNQQNALTGYIDELGLFAQALPHTLIKHYSTKTPEGNEKGLITYLSFERQERNSQNDIVLQPDALSIVTHYDMDGNPTEERDSVFISSVDEIKSRIDKNGGAPVQLFKEMVNLNFDFVGRDNQLMVNINEQNSRINKCNLYVTVTEIPDMNGNYMASPATVSFYVDRNPLRWNERVIKREWQSGEEQEIELHIMNNSGSQHSYTIENLPRWMTVSTVSDVMLPLEEDVVTLTVSADLNVGIYDERIYLTDENGLSEPLSLELTVKGEEPAWSVDQKLMRYSMSIVGQVNIGNDIVTDTRDIVAAFDEKGACLGKSHIDYNEQLGQALVYMTVYDSVTVRTVNGQALPLELNFRLWHAGTGKTMLLNTSQKVTFSDQAIAGTVKNPIRMTANDMYIQNIKLKEGWNWISFNVYNPSLLDMKEGGWMTGFPWQNGDIVTSDSLTLTYKNGSWMTDRQPASGSLFNSLLFRVRVQRDLNIEVVGTGLNQPLLRTISVKKGWNGIGYTPMVNLPLATALADYLDDATDGDLIKSQHEFAMFTEGANGSREWTGSLKYLKPGEGYMLYRQGDGQVQFLYPFYEPGSTFVNSIAMTRPYSSTMTMVATADGIELQEGDRLVAYSNGEIVGEADASGQLFFLSIEGDVAAPVILAIERDGGIVATAPDVMTYEANAISGTPNEPTSISFVTTNPEQWSGDSDVYDIAGRKVVNRQSSNRKLPRGVYIYNGKKQVIK